MYDLVVSIVLYNNRFKDIEPLIEKISKINKSKKICLVDNSCQNMISKKEIEKYDLVYIKNKENIGFGRGHNIIIEKFLDKTKVFLIVNPDIEITSGKIEEVIEFLLSNNRIGVLSPKIEHEDVDEHLVATYHLVPSPFHLFFKRFLYIFFKKFIDNYNLKPMNKDKINFVPNLSGCCLFIKSEVFRKIGKFDERFFLYMEDVDFVRRVAEHYETIYYPFLTVKHVRNSLSYRKIKFLLIHIQSAIKYFNKWGWIFDEKRRLLNKKTLKLLEEE